MSSNLSRRTLLLGTAAVGAASSFAVPATASVRGPVVHRDRSVTLAYSSRTARSVVVRGGWGPSYGLIDQPMTSDGRGRWHLTTAKLNPSYYFYSFLVDGVETKDPANPRTVHAAPTRTTFLVPGRGAEFLTEHHVAHGRVEPLHYRSKVTGTVRTATVWTPPGFRGGLPTLYLQHGGGGDYLDWIQPGRAHVILDNLYAARRIRPMVVVMPDGNVPGSTGVPTDDSYPAELLESLVPAVERSYRVSRSAEHRALAGLSLGGLQTWNVLLTRPGAMAYIGDFSSGYFPDIVTALGTTYAELLRNPRINRGTRLHRVYCGNPDDIAYSNNIATRALFDRFGIRHTYSEFAAGGHTWQTWYDNLYDFAPRLFR